MEHWERTTAHMFKESTAAPARMDKEGWDNEDSFVQSWSSCSGGFHGQPAAPNRRESIREKDGCRLSVLCKSVQAASLYLHVYESRPSFQARLVAPITAPT